MHKNILFVASSQADECFEHVVQTFYNALGECLTRSTNVPHALLDFKQMLVTRSKCVHHMFSVCQLTSEERRKVECLD